MKEEENLRFSLQENFNSTQREGIFPIGGFNVGGLRWARHRYSFRQSAVLSDRESLPGRACLVNRA